MPQRQTSIAKYVLLLSSLSSILILGFAAYRENYSPAWRGTQEKYQKLLVRTANTDRDRNATKAFRVGIRQLFLTDLGGIDRCTSCHLGVENPAMADVELPFRKHPGDILVNHPPDSFGCTFCHGGEGRATRRDAAHGWRENGEPTPDIETPLLRGDAVYTSCGRCHYEVDLYGGQSDIYAASFGAQPTIKKPQITKAVLELPLPGAGVLAKGKKLVVQNGCLGCHKYRGGGGDLGADLTYIGDETKHHFNFAHIRGEHTVEQWLYEHFLNPDQVTPKSVMPNMGFTPDQARSLALYMMSLHRKSAPATHTPRPLSGNADSNEPVGGETLYKMFCSSCHGAGGHGDGPAAKTIAGQPRDFWHGRFRYVSTMNGVPTQEDLVRTISTGRKFGEMPSDPELTKAEVLALADYIRQLNRAGWVEKLTKESEEEDDDESPEEIQEIAEAHVMPKRVIIVPWPGNDFKPDPAVGRKLFLANCKSCHGPEGHGDGPQKLVDEKGRPIKARDLAAGDFRGGSEPDEIFKRIRAGMPGTPMPAQKQLKDEEIWQLVYYVRALASIKP